MPAASATAQDQAGPDAALVDWARAHAMPSDSAFAFLRGLVGRARILALGEPVHGGHEPLAFRNRLIAHAVERLGFTAVALESGLTESMLADDFIQGRGGDIDSVTRYGLTWSFQYLPENRALLGWLKEHNARTARKVHLYGIDLTGAEDDGVYPNAGRAVRAALADLRRVAPARGAELAATLEPMMDRFLPARYSTYTAAERTALARALGDLDRELRAAPAGAKPEARRLKALGVRNAWIAIRLNDIMALPPDQNVAGAVLRDSTMAENTRWVRVQEGARGRIVLFAHDGHIKNAATALDIPAFRGSVKAQDQYLRSWFGPDLVTIGSVAGTFVGRVNSGTGWLEDGGDTPAEPGTFAATLRAVGIPGFVLDLRTGDRAGPIREALERPLAFQVREGPAPFSPRQAFDAIVYFDRVSRTMLLR